MEVRSLEHGLAQKLMILENAAARVSTVKAQLRTNIDQARKEVRSVMSQQMLLIRAREQELLDELDVIMNHRETNIEHQQQILYRKIWECKQLLEKLRGSGGGSPGFTDVLSSLGHVEMSSKESAHVSFESDAIGLRSILLSFGTIRTSSKNDGVNRSAPGESLPMEMEEYEDDQVMTHKSVLRINRAPTNSSNMSKQQVDSVRKWLKKIPSGSGALEADMSSIMAEFDVIKTSSPEVEVESSDSASSFDLIPQEQASACGATFAPGTPAEKVLSAEFLNTLQQPLSSWLMRVIPNEQQKVEKKRPNALYESLPTMKRPHSCSDVKRHYEFEDVIDSVRTSSDDIWVLSSEPPKKTRTEETSSSGDPSTSELECETKTPIAFNEKEFLASLSKLFVSPTSATPSSIAPEKADNPPQVDLSTVLGWKQVLDRIEQAAPYWLQE
ncbi:unnamed protein product [Nippostrongylus brasiliensis]|uniref:GTD-binding domain-containing protein n=1 Tax=Nippostrongylus brasiliensis TaxID=27835 RepID=A0A0N4YBK1_NIPBR|nr:unnamed protein product [Nippostrongylus brasiliensis]